MVELSYADAHQYTVMIVFVNAALAFIAVPHAYPFMYIAV